MSKKWFELARKANSQWNGLVAEFHPSSSLLHRSPLLSIRPNRFSSKIFFFPLKRATAAGWPVKRKGGRGIKRRRRRSLAGLLCSVLFHCESNRHSLGSPFCLTTAMALASAAPLSFSLSFEDNVHYCCWEEENPSSQRILASAFSGIFVAKQNKKVPQVSFQSASTRRHLWFVCFRQEKNALIDSILLKKIIIIIIIQLHKSRK